MWRVAADLPAADLVGTASAPDDYFELDAAHTYARSLGTHALFLTSAHTGEGVAELFEGTHSPCSDAELIMRRSRIVSRNGCTKEVKPWRSC